MKNNVILETNFPTLKFVKKGKVRDLYDLGDYYLIVSTDRLSAFDVIMAQGIPFKGKVLNRISEFWFNHTSHIVKNHLITTDINKFPNECLKYADVLEGRSMLVKKTDVIPIESVVRGYITGSGWADYKRTGEVCGIKLPEGMEESEKFSEPLFTPSTKAEIGLHDENISEQKAKEIAGADTIKFIKEMTIEIYKSAVDYALSKGIIIADTKMEFGRIGNEIILVDELLTPDSSRFWPLDKYEKGKSQESFDKQFVRDHLISVKFNKQPPPPMLPEDIIHKTSEKYLEALKMLTGESL
ncbi:MAG: phosphoribosylaminoimidazolesuccinocarboxamide synthase [Ignavibacteriota bacterium]|nr:phosphoribosylaminoimidazolesuccinocarboxamide synthase [Ignavibacteriota bacterium]MCO6447544.1 phosphoribosylaminoimidazolesuccinocarboxamide synthase [Ignavibacterium album]QKJ99465.1 MAG: phosphoribosylaminoimidazolesuccinocarboxamide synthase [Ignavibacteriota bacterium]HOJ06872.1 phosphoribosylaminoimidazolesuccinocarboxamide synthase [Ignavibacteriaceae bacterium]